MTTPGRQPSLRKKLTIPIITLVLTLIGGIIVAYVTPGSFLIHPEFRITIESDSQSPYDIIQITNTGWIQAKSVEITIHSRDQSAIMGNRCDEASFEVAGNATNLHRVTMARLSQNLPCQITMSSFGISNYYDIIVTAEDSPAFKYSGASNTTQSLSNPAYLPFLLATAFALLVAFAVHFYFRYFD